VAAIVATQIRHANDMTALAERQVLTRALIAGAPIAVLAMDADGRLIEFNPAAERLSGYRRDDVLGQPLSEILVPERDRPRILEHISTYLATGNPEEFTGQLRVPTLHADGTERVAELTPVQITVGGRTIFTGFLRDLTEIERSHAELAEQNERLRKLDEARNQFLAIVSHELRTPLTSIVSFSELIKGEADGLTPEGVKFLDIIERKADRLHRLVALIRHPGQTLTPDQLLKLAWNDPLGVGPDRVKFGVMRLRRKLGQGAGEPGAAIEAVRGFGYRYVPPA
jgi:PAS domain S-box-containing protein